MNSYRKINKNENEDFLLNAQENFMDDSIEENNNNNYQILDLNKKGNFIVDYFILYFYFYFY